jgi:hypothetical protein
MKKINYRAAFAMSRARTDSVESLNEIDGKIELTPEATMFPRRTECKSIFTREYY